MDSNRKRRDFLLGFFQLTETIASKFSEHPTRLRSRTSGTREFVHRRHQSGNKKKNNNKQTKRDQYFKDINHVLGLQLHHFSLAE